MADYPGQRDRLDAALDPTLPGPTENSPSATTSPMIAVD